MIVTCLLAIIPVIGFATWVLAIVVIPLVIIFAIVILTRGGTTQGIILLFCAIILMPGWLFLAPVVSTLVLGASVSAQETAQEKQILGNLNTIDTAKTQWAADSGANSGAAVTMSDLSKYLGGQPIKPVVGETYDPHPVGEAPSAKLPASKALAGHKAGEEITVSSAAATTSTSATSAATATPSPSASAEDEE